MVTLEELLDKIADELITDDTGIITPNVVRENQKTIRNGTIQLFPDINERLVLYQKDVEANEKDLLFTTGDGAVLIGRLAGGGNSSAKQETVFVGDGAGRYISSAFNTAVGTRALEGATTGGSVFHIITANANVCK